jgi:hypothetical protein
MDLPKSVTHFYITQIVQISLTGNFPLSILSPDKENLLSEEMGKLRKEDLVILHPQSETSPLPMSFSGPQEVQEPCSK